METMTYTLYPDHMSADEQISQADVDAYCSELAAAAREHGIELKFDVQWNVTGVGTGCDSDEINDLAQRIFDRGSFWT